MVKTAEVLAIVPARGGSKSLPRKNIKLFAGHPLITYSIAAGLQAQTVTRVIVSTDDEEIAAVARSYGAETPFLRPAELAQDNTLDLPVFEHALRWLGEHENYVPDVVVQLRPTSPVRPPTCVDDAVNILLKNKNADSVRGIVPSGQNPHKMWRVDPQSGMMHNLLDVPGVPEPYNAPRQVLPQIYWQTGHIDAIRPATILEQGSMSGAVVYPLMIDQRYTVDIDTIYDWMRAEWLLANVDLPCVRPGPQPRKLPARVDLVVFDFDGVMTDNRVWVDEQGHEMVAANRGDGMGIEALRNKNIQAVVMSTETNPVVTARCRKLNIPVIQGIGDKAGVLRSYLEEKNIPKEQVVYLGNDINDVPCFPLVGCAYVPVDAHPDALRQADGVLTRRGGHGAVRELCDLIIAKISE